MITLFIFGLMNFNYKLRAECSADADALQKIIPKDRLIEFQTGKLSGFPDVGILIKTSGMEITEILEAIGKIPDSHVMMDTLALETNYTGGRDYLF